MVICLIIVMTEYELFRYSSNTIFAIMKYVTLFSISIFMLVASVFKFVYRIITLKNEEHEKFYNISSLVLVGLMFLFTLAYIIFETIARIEDHHLFHLHVVGCLLGLVLITILPSISLPKEKE
mgnify:CR=1 FL=1